MVVTKAPSSIELVARTKPASCLKYRLLLSCISNQAELEVALARRIRTLRALPTCWLWLVSSIDGS